MVQISFTVDGEIQMSRDLMLLVEQIENPKEFYDEAVEIVNQRINETFSSQGATVEKGVVWTDLAPSTKKARERRWGYYKNSPSKPGILRWTGKGQSKRVQMSNNLFGKIEMVMPYMAYHHRGSGKLPRRSVIDLSNETNAKIVKAFQKIIWKSNGIFGKQV